MDTRQRPEIYPQIAACKYDERWDPGSSTSLDPSDEKASLRFDFEYQVFGIQRSILGNLKRLRPSVPALGRSTQAKVDGEQEQQPTSVSPDKRERSKELW